MVLSTIYIFPIYDGNEEVLTIINEGGSRNDNVMNNENNAANMNINNNNNNNNNSYNDNRTPFDTFYEKNQGHYHSSSESDKRRFYSKLIPRLAILISCAFLSFMIIIYLIRTIPDLSLPTSIQDVKNQTIILRDYSKNSWRGFLHILFVLSFIYIWKQAFSVPGALFLNILAGSIYGSANATLFTCLLTSTGASVAYLLSRFIGKPIADFYLSDKLIYLRKQVDENRENLFYYLLFVRLFPLSPWWFLNIASPLLLIPIRTFFITMFFGSIPYNFASCQSGEIISEINSTTDILQPILLFKLLLISLLTLVPPLLSKRIKFSNFSRLLKENKDYQKHMLLISSDQII